MKKLLLTFLFVSLSSANDSAYFARGNQLIPIQETDIAVKKEVLTIRRIDDNKVRVTVDYTFHNPTAEKSILMGFEASSPYGDVDGTPKKGRHPYIEKFSVRINDKAIAHQVAIMPLTQAEEDKPLYTLNDLKTKKPTPDIDNTNAADLFYVYHFPATFAPGDTSVKHVYEYEISGAVFISTQIDYMLTPALRWANQQVDDFTLIIDLGEFQQYHIEPTFFKDSASWSTQGRVKIAMEDVKHAMSGETSNMMTVWQHHGSVTFHAKNFKPQGELSLFANRAFSEEDTLDADTMILALHELPHLDDKKLKNEFTKKVLENLPYARRGYIFQNQKLKAFFDKQPWYMPDAEYKDATISEEESAWLKKLRTLP